MPVELRLYVLVVLWERKWCFMADWMNERDLASVKASILAHEQDKEINDRPVTKKTKKCWL